MEQTDINLDFEAFLKDELGLTLDISKQRKAGICKYFLRGQCPLGNQCQYRHYRSEVNVVCKHWLRGLCKKGESCEFLHEYNLRKMPECYFWSQYGECSNPECLYLHIDPKARVRECLNYSRGFCRVGPLCRYRHVRLVICQRYITGFCPFGANCEFSQYFSFSNKYSPKFEMSDIVDFRL